MKVSGTINVIIEVFNWGRRDTDELKNARYVEFKTERGARCSSSTRWTQAR